MTIDTAKGCGILLVVFAHINHMHPYWSIIYAFHIPLFFFITGMNFHPEKYPTFRSLMKNKCRTMLIPYLVFCLFGAVYAVTGGLLEGNSFLECLDLLGEILFAVVWAPSSKNFQTFNTPMWFVPCLLLVEIMFYYLQKTKSKPLFWISIALLTSIGWLTESPHIHGDFSILPWNFSSACFSLSFFAVGYSLNSLIQKEIIAPKLTKNQVLKLALLFIPSFLITGYIGAHNSASIGSRELNNGFYLLITGLTGTLCVLIGARFLQNSKLLTYCGRNSFAFMGSQIPIYWTLCGIRRAIEEKTGTELSVLRSENMLGSIVLFLLVSGLCILTAAVYNRCKRGSVRKKAR